MSGEKQISLGRSTELYESECDDDTPTQDCVTEQSKHTNEGALYVGWTNRLDRCQVQGPIERTVLFHSQSVISSRSRRGA